MVLKIYKKAVKSEKGSFKGNNGGKVAKLYYEKALKMGMDNKFIDNLTRKRINAYNKKAFSLSGGSLHTAVVGGIDLLLKNINEYANKMGTDHLGGDDYTSKKRGGLRDFDGYDNVDYNKDMPMDEMQVVNKKTGKDITKHVLALLSGKIDKKKFEKLTGLKKESVVQEAMRPSQIRSAISKVKKQLMRKWKQKGGYENFGQKELSQMKDKFDYNPYGSPDERQISKMLDGFDNWAMNYDGNMRESVNESMFSTIDQIRQDSKDVRDFVKNVFKDREFKKMSNDKDFIKYLKSIYEGVNENSGISNWMQGRTSDYHTALRGKNRDYSGGTNFKKKNHGQPDVEEDDEDQETNHLSNKQTHIKSPLKMAESGKKKSDKNYKDWKSSRLRKEISKKLKEYGQRLDLSFIEDEEAKLDGTYPSTDAIDRDIDETAKRDYKDEYKKFQSSKKSKKYRAELNKYNRQKGTYGNGDGKDASHKGGKIVGFESASKNRGRKEKSRLKKENVAS